MNDFTLERITKVTKEYAELETLLCALAKILQRCEYPPFNSYSQDQSWFVYEIETVDPTLKTIEIAFSSWFEYGQKVITVKIPILWLQLDDPTDEIKFHMELAK